MWIRRKILGVALYRWVLMAAVLLSLLAVSLLLRGQLNIEWNMSSLRRFVQSLGMWGPLSYIGILVFRFVFLIPSGLLLLAAGVLFGPLYGTLYAGLGLFGAGLWKFGIVSIVGQNVFVRQFPENAREWLQRAKQRKANTWALAGICAYPFIPKHLFQFAAIFTGLNFVHYALAVGLGSFIRAGLFANAGEALYSGIGIYAAVAALMLALAIPLCISRWRNNFKEALSLSYSLLINRSKS